jgi:hypothetical protein
MKQRRIGCLLKHASFVQCIFIANAAAAGVTAAAAADHWCRGRQGRLGRLPLNCQCTQRVAAAQVRARFTVHTVNIPMSCHSCHFCHFVIICLLLYRRGLSLDILGLPGVEALTAEEAELCVKINCNTSGYDIIMSHFVTCCCTTLLYRRGLSLDISGCLVLRRLQQKRPSCVSEHNISPYVTCFATLLYCRGLSLDISGLPGVDALTAKEAELCANTRLLPAHYLSLKDVMMRDAQVHGHISRTDVSGA